MKRLSLIFLSLIFAFGFTLVWAEAPASIIPTGPDADDLVSAGEVGQPDLSLQPGDANIIDSSVQPASSPGTPIPVETPAPAAVINLPELGFHFGQVKEGAIVQHDFIIKNTGTTDLCIYKVDAACVCTTAQPVPQLIKPGGEGILKVTLNTARKFDGEYVEELTIYSNDPLQPFIKLMIKADICNSSVSAAENKQGEATLLKTITPKDARELLKAKRDALLVDVRQPEEYNEGHIPGSLLLPLEHISAEAPLILTNKDAVIIVYCRSGKRSQRAARKLTDMGYQNVNDLGGILDWPYEVEK